MAIRTLTPEQRRALDEQFMDDEARQKRLAKAAKVSGMPQISSTQTTFIGTPKPPRCKVVETKVIYQRELERFPRLYEKMLRNRVKILNMRDIIQFEELDASCTGFYCHFEDDMFNMIAFENHDDLVWFKMKYHATLGE